MTDSNCLLAAVRKDVAFDAIIRQELIRRQVDGGGNRTPTPEGSEGFWQQFGWTDGGGSFVCIQGADFTREA